MMQPPANTILYIPCPFCGTGNPVVQTDPASGAQAVICANPNCGGCAPAPTWNRRSNKAKLHLIKNTVVR